MIATSRVLHPLEPHEDTYYVSFIDDEIGTAYSNFRPDVDAGLDLDDNQVMRPMIQVFEDHERRCGWCEHAREQGSLIE